MFFEENCFYYLIK